jgi:hypothetical protein
VDGKFAIFIRRGAGPGSLLPPAWASDLMVNTFS